jgi:hypothetical protein
MTQAASPTKVKIAERRRLAMQLRIQGGSYELIAERMRQEEGISKSYNAKRAQEDVIAELQAVGTENRAMAQEVLALDLQRLDTMLMTVWPKMLKGDYFAFDRVLAVLDRRARYFNLTAPQPINAVIQASGNVAIGGTQINPVLQQLNQIVNVPDDELSELIQQQQAILAAYAGAVTGGIDSPQQIAAPADSATGSADENDHA